ncbi:MAG: glycoside hydrolase family 9 protein, partial [Oscillospiraceae bacterium]|nr:glycoside hydrolase family 9 protein [Oscillospiraceae bacterium]
MKKMNTRFFISIICAAAIFMGTAAHMPVYAETENIILNSAFDSDKEGWGGYANHEASASIDYDNGQIAVKISALGTVNYAVQLGSSVFSLTENCTYQVSFDMYSTEERYIEAILQQNGGSYQAYSSMALTLATEPKTFTHTFSMDSATDENVKLVFNCGNHGEDIPEHTIYIDNVLITQLAEGDTGYDPYEPPITLNQLGYKPDAEKTAVFRNITTETEFSVINAENDEVIYTGELYGEKANELADEINFYGDFSSITETGTYYIKCGDLDPSYSFEISENVYDDVLDAAVRMLYLQRCGSATDDETFGHEACHTGTALVPDTDTYVDVSGGWHDAGDYGRYIVPSSKAVADIMLAYQTNPALYGDSSGIPESGNGIADILDEARYELEWMLKMQAESGGVYHKVICTVMCGTIMPEKYQGQIVLTPVS